MCNNVNLPAYIFFFSRVHSIMLERLFIRILNNYYLYTKINKYPLIIQPIITNILTCILHVEKHDVHRRN